MSTISGKAWWIIGLLIICGGIVIVVLNIGWAYNQNQTPSSVPVRPLTTEQKYNVLGALGSRTVMGTSTGATTTPAQEKVRQEIVKNVAATSATSTQSASEKLNTLKALQH